MLLGEGEGIAVGDGARGVVMTGALIGGRVFRIGFLNPDVEVGLAVGEGVAA